MPKLMHDIQYRNKEQRENGSKAASQNNQFRNNIVFTWCCQN